MKPLAGDRFWGVAEKRSERHGISGRGVGSELMTSGFRHEQVTSCAVAALRGRSSSINHEGGMEIPSNTSNIAFFSVH